MAKKYIRVQYYMLGITIVLMCGSILINSPLYLDIISFLALVGLTLHFDLLDFSKRAFLSEKVVCFFQVVLLFISLIKFFLVIHGSL
ncbi:hypothetical protein [Levilactobacillus namurensis]|uniref:hypothetical protein n=1 Tax=Levilactobacillus namurensis TaxID=380393 RepID=UPI0026F264CE|nr:hypothetical protein [Levilactobacillus namurensis]